jgi:hypothetical protein
MLQRQIPSYPNRRFSASLKPIYDYLDTEKKLALQSRQAAQGPLDSYISISRGLVLSDNRASPNANV